MLVLFVIRFKMNKLQKVLGIGALILALTSGCSKPIKSGRVVDKQYEPQREYSVRQSHDPRLLGFLQYDTYTDDEDFIIIFKSDKEGENKTRTVYVNKEVYDSLKLNDIFDTSKLPFEDFDQDYRK